MFNVLHLINYPGKGGTERYILSLAEGLHKNMCKFYMAWSKDGPLIKSAEELGIETIKINMRSPFDIVAAWELKKICSQYSIHIVHTHFLRERYIVVLSKLLGNKCALINTVHIFSPRNILINILNSIVSLFEDRVITVCKALKKYLIAAGMNEQKIDVIYNGIDPDIWNDKRTGNIRKEFGISDIDLVVVSVARFTGEKGHIFFLETIKWFKKLIAQNNYKLPGKIYFLLVGDGEMLDKCKNFAGMLNIDDITIFTGFRKDIREIYHDSDIFVSHSESEGLSIAILEALACGLPVIATDVGGSNEIIGGTCKCGELVPYGDKKTFAEVIEKYVKDKYLREKCADNAKQYVNDRFNLENTVKKTYEEYVSSIKATD